MAELFASMKDQLLASVCRIEARGEGAPVVSTGCFMHLASGRAGRQIPALLLSREAVAGAARVILGLRSGAVEDGRLVPEDEELSIEIPDLPGRILPHPDPEVDLAALPLAPLVQLARHAGKQLFYSPLEEAFLGVDRVLAGLHKVERVAAVGFTDPGASRPVLREGLTGDHPASDFRGRPLGLIDRAAVPGAPGSPVVIVDEGEYRRGDETVAGDRLILLGWMTGTDPFAVGGGGGPIPVGDAPGPDQSAPGLYVKARCGLELGRAIRDRIGTVRGS